MSSPVALHAPPSLAHIVATLRKRYGKPEPPPSRDPFELIPWENVAYMADDVRRARAFAMLRERVGTQPQDILDAPMATLRAVTSHGIVPDLFARKLRDAARLALDEFDGDLRAVLKLPRRESMKALRRFPGIGEPSAEKILLFTRGQPILGLDSNGLRVLRRLGYGADKKNYSATYASVREALAPTLPRRYDTLIAAHQLLRHLGKELCKVSAPRCGLCPLAGVCAHALRHRRTTA
jgi:A/G-specific adenine glycosylase